MIDLSQYNTIIFDCDGVILNSNGVKTEAFRTASLPWGERIAKSLVDYHIANGGVSRYHKFKHLIEFILPKYLPDAIPGVDGPGFNELLESYSAILQHELLNCSVAAGLESLKQKTIHASWCIVSGGDQSELRQLFTSRSLYYLFDSGIFGSPDNKDTIIMREISSGKIRLPAIFFGDSLYDYKTSLNTSIDFVFVSGWSEFSNWQDFVLDKNLPHIVSLCNLL